jgi:hypothetical protein
MPGHDFGWAPLGLTPIWTRLTRSVWHWAPVELDRLGPWPFLNQQPSHSLQNVIQFRSKIAMKYGYLG